LRMKRRVWDILSLALLAVGLAVVALGMISFRTSWVLGHVRHTGVGYDSISIASAQGMFGVHLKRMTNEGDSAEQAWQHQRNLPHFRPGWRMLVQDLRKVPPGPQRRYAGATDWSYHGFSLIWRVANHPPPDPTTLVTRAVAVPHWFAALVLSLPALLRFGRFIRGRRRQRRGMCAGCGYDLRATPEKCPECGRVITRAAEVAG
jgi:hypothetical protein